MIEHPITLLFLLLLLPLGLISVRRYRNSAPAVLAIAGGSAREVSNLFLIRWFFSGLAFLLSLTGVVFALSGVRWGNEAASSRPAVAEVVFAFDISRSMLAEDIVPSRLGRSVAVARSLVSEFPQNPFGIVVFKGRGETFLPVTRDSTAIETYLDAITVSIMTAPGTNIAEGLSAARQAFPSGTDSRRLIVLFSDGGDLEGRPASVADTLTSDRIELALVGSAGEVAVPIRDGEGYVIDAGGARVLSSLDERLLRSIANSADGELYRIDSDELIADLGKLISSAPTQRVTADRYRVVLVGSLLCIVLWVVLRSVRWGGLF